MSDENNIEVQPELTEEQLLSKIRQGMELQATIRSKKEEAEKAKAALIAMEQELVELQGSFQSLTSSIKYAMESGKLV
jgi:hypothetical protein